jgi:hypothetical protein
MIEILINTGYFNHDTATDFLHKLEQFGHTVYKKKVFANGRRPNSSQPITPEISQAIRAYYAKNSDVTQQQIANHFNVNSGRVAEALRD